MVRKWAGCWDEVRFCSKACRRALTRTDRALEAAILDLLGRRAHSATIEVSEAARAVGGDDWRALSERARRAARRLVAAGQVEITQAGRVVDPSRARGPMRVRASRGRSG